MTRRLWIADEHSATHAAITGANARHLAQVLRAQAGQQFEVSCDGVIFLGRITSVVPERVEFELLEKIEARPLPAVSLLLSVFKFDRMEWAIEKATELGVAEIYPVIARRTEAHLAKAVAKRVERWRKIAREASQQSRRAAEPVIAEPTKLKQAIGDTKHMPLRYVLAETEQAQTLAAALREADAASAVLLAVGPEGGWSADELELFREHGWHSVSLGPTILRAETAAIAALSLATLR
ncbi:MAG: 16S rRNA (uracil(1498)-N(3))-methyltransferase [Acidobacteriales bacterium]|nr:16S rRNA (uracil(1498)-N(3))-methyltransferase [Terriglobales bacterium]